MQQSLVPTIFFYHILIVPTLHGMAVISKQNHTFIPDPILLHTDHDLVLKSTRNTAPAIGSRHNVKNALSTGHKLRLIAGRTRMYTNDSPAFDLISHQTAASPSPPPPPTRSTPCSDSPPATAPSNTACLCRARRRAGAARLWSASCRSARTVSSWAVPANDTGPAAAGRRAVNGSSCAAVSTCRRGGGRPACP